MMVMAVKSTVRYDRQINPQARETLRYAHEPKFRPEVDKTRSVSTRRIVGRHTLTNQSPQFCRVPTYSVYGFIFGTYKIVGSLR